MSYSVGFPHLFVSMFSTLISDHIKHKGVSEKSKQLNYLNKIAINVI